MKLVRILVMAGLCVAVVALSAWGAMILVSMRAEPEAAPPMSDAPLVEVVSARATRHTFDVPAQGTVSPRTESDLVAEVSGRVTAVSPALVNGGFFEEGAVLFSIDSGDYELAVAQAQLEVARTQRLLAQELADAQVARSEWETMGRGDASPLVLREPHLAEARAAVAAAQAALERAQRDLDRTEVRAPYAGRVREKNLGVGQYVMPGTRAGRIYAVDYAEIRLPLPDSQLSFLDLPVDYRGEDPSFVGPEVLIEAAFAGKTYTWKGAITRTEGEIDARTRMVVAVARVENPYGRGEDLSRPPLAVGLFVTGYIRGRTSDNVYVLPREVLRTSDRVWVVDGEDRLRFRQVDVARAGREHVVIEKGLAPGDRVVVSPLEVATDQMHVRVRARGAEPVVEAGESAQ